MTDLVFFENHAVVFELQNEIRASFWVYPTIEGFDYKSNTRFIEFYDIDIGMNASHTVDEFNKNTCFCNMMGFLRHPGCWDETLFFNQEEYSMQEITELIQLYTKDIEPWIKRELRKENPDITYEE